MADAKTDVDVDKTWQGWTRVDIGWPMESTVKADAFYSIASFNFVCYFLLQVVESRARLIILGFDACG